jgi:uncharacterized membrane protein YdjX (TVP38/TMEM64 family)
MADRERHDEPGCDGRKPMIEPPSSAVPPKLNVRRWSRAIIVVLICTSAALLLSVDEVYGSLRQALSVAEPLIAGHPYLGAVAFVLLAAMSAILAFFSSALLLPAAVYTWGNAVTLGLLWLGWLLGGLCTYALGRGLRRPQAKAKASRTSSEFDFYRQRFQGEVTFALVLLLHLAMPSEIPGYLCGYLGVRLRTYVAALALAELPYAVGAVLLGDGVVNRHIGWLVAVGLVGAAFSLYALRVLHERLDQPSSL